MPFPRILFVDKNLHETLPLIFLQKWEDLFLLYDPCGPERASLENPRLKALRYRDL